MSKRLTTLAKEVEELRKQFLPEPFDPVGAYPEPEKVRAHTRAFLVLAHAAIETYLEDSARDIAEAAEVVWSKHGRIALPLSFLLAAEKPLQLAFKLPKPGAPDAPQLHAAKVNASFQAYYARVSGNHGVKERNVLKLFVPLGAPAVAFGTTLMSDLDALGSPRGQHAHNSTKAVKTVLDPEDQYKKLTQLVADLSVLDRWVTTYKRKIR